MLSWEQFIADLAPLRAVLEQRRRRYLRYFYIGVGMAAVLLATAFFAPEATLHGIQRLLHVHAPLKSSDILAYRFFALLCTAALMLGPILSHRGERGFSVERAVAARLFGPFGSFTPAKGGGIRAAELRKTGLFATTLVFEPGTGVMGEMNGARVKLCEAIFFRREGGVETLVFNGLLIFCDAGSPLPRAAHEALRGHMLQLAQFVPQVKRGWDEKIVLAAGALYARLKAALLLRLGKNELPAEKAYRLKYAVRPRFSRAGQPFAQDAISAPAHMEYPQGHCLVMIAGDNDLFALGSLFAPALGEARLRRLYEVMQGVDTLTRSLRLS